MSDPAPHRRGEPSPLVLHLNAAVAAYQQALMAAPRAGDAGFPWVPELAEAGRTAGTGLDRIAVAAEAAHRLSATIRGLEVWQSHPYRRAVPEPPCIWQRGCSRLLDYGPPEGAPVLVVPSLINRAYILDLTEQRSLLRWLAAQGLRPLLLEWGQPGPDEAAFDLEAYGRDRLLPALAAIQAQTGRAVALLGYCMGGTLAAGLAARRPDGITALATIGAPWDFAPSAGIAGGLRAMLRTRGQEQVLMQLDALQHGLGMAPVPLFQLLFAIINPVQAAVKFRKLAALDPRSDAVRDFIAVEDWLADGVAMPVPAARDLLVNWQVRNHTGQRRWQFLGGRVDPAQISLPAACFCGTRDSIAPPELSAALAQAIPGAALHQTETGHIGMIVGSRARAQVWEPLAQFLRRHAG